MHHSASKRSVSVLSEPDGALTTLYLVLIGVDGYLRGYQIFLTDPDGIARKGHAHEPQQRCVLRWKTKLPGLRHGGLAACAARPFTPPLPVTSSSRPLKMSDLTQHASCSHCRNALLKCELHNQVSRDGEDGAKACQPETVSMMPSEAYLPENWLAIFEPSVREEARRPAAPSPTAKKATASCILASTSNQSGSVNALTVSRTSPASPTQPSSCGLDGDATEECIVPLVRRPHWFWWEAPRSERLPSVDCLCDHREGEGPSGDATSTPPDADPLGSWMPFDGAPWNRGSCPWHRLNPLFEQQDALIELDVATGVMRSPGDADAEEDGDGEMKVVAAPETSVGGASSEGTKGGKQKSTSLANTTTTTTASDRVPSLWASVKREEDGCAPPLAAVSVPLLLRMHCTKLLSTGASTRFGSSGGSGSSDKKARVPSRTIGRTAAGAMRLTADLRDTELALPFALTERERTLSHRLSAVLRCAADGVVDVLATPSDLPALFASPDSSSMSSPLSADATAARSCPSYGSRIDELMERVEVEAATVGAFAVARIATTDCDHDILVLPLPVRAAEMEEALRVSTESDVSKGVWSWAPNSSHLHAAVHDHTRAGFQGPHSDNSGGAAPQTSLTHLVTFASTPSFARERMVSGLLLQSEGTPMQLVQGTHFEEVHAAAAFGDDLAMTAREQEEPTPHTSCRTALRASVANDQSSTTDTSSDDSESDSDDASGSAMDSVTTSSTRVSFAMPGHRASSAWASMSSLTTTSPPGTHGFARGGGGPSGPGLGYGSGSAGASQLSFFDENFDPVLLLGRGTSGAALLARHRTTGVFYAVKVLLARDYESERSILKEMSLHATLENRHLVRYHACWSEFVTLKRAMQLSFVGLCDRKEALVLPSAHSSPRGGGGGFEQSGLYLNSNSVSEEHLHLHGGRSSTAVGPRSFRAGARGTLHIPRRMHWGSLQLGAAHTMMSGPRLLIGEESFSGTSLSSMATAAETPTRHNTSVRQEASATKQGGGRGRSVRCALAHGQSSAAIVDVCSSADSSSSSVSATQQRHRDPSTSHHLSLADFGEDDDDEESEDEDEDDDGAASFVDGSEHCKGAVVGSRLIFLQMEYCQTTLAHYLVQRTGIDRVENLVILLQLVAGLRYMHQCGILHRDVKPTNIFVDFRCQLGAAPINPNSSDDDEDIANGGGPASPCPATEAGALIDPHCMTASCMPHSASLWSTSSTLTHRLEASDLDNGSTDDLVQQELRKMVNSRGYRSSDDILRERREQHVRQRGDGSRGSGPASAAVIIDDVKPAADADRARTRATTSAAPPRSSSHDALLRKDYRWLLERLVQVRIGDFGLAKPIQQQATFDVHGDGFHSMNNANTVGVGSPVYSSPEQLKGRHCTSASDAYSLGVVMAEMYLLPSTVAERLVTLREVRDGMFPRAGLLKQYPELSVVKALTNPIATRRLSLQAMHRQLKRLLMEHLQRALFSNEEDAPSASVPST